MHLDGTLRDISADVFENMVVADLFSVFDNQMPEATRLARELKREKDV
jgi:hypothetical protein